MNFGRWFLIAFASVALIAAIFAVAAFAATEATIGSAVSISPFSVYPGVCRAGGNWAITSLMEAAGNNPGIETWDNATVLRFTRGDSDPIGGETDPAAAASASRLLVVYPSYNDASNTAHLIGLLYDLNGTLLDREFILSLTATAANWHNPAVVNLPSTDEFFIAYRQMLGSVTEAGVWGIVVDTGTGSIVTTAGPVEYWSTGGGKIDVAVGRAFAGPFPLQRYVIVFRASGASNIIRAQSVVTGTGAAWGASVALPILGAGAGDPSIAGTADGLGTDMLVTWHHNTGTAFTISGQHINGVAATLGLPFTIATSASDPDVARGDSEFLVAYDKFSPSPGSPDDDKIEGRYVTTDGTVTGAAFDIVADMTKVEGHPAVATDGVDYVVACEMSNGTVPYGEDVYLQRVGPGAFTFVNTDISSGTPATRGTGWANWRGPSDEHLPELYLANESSASAMYRNDGAADLALMSGTAALATGGEGVAWADYDNDGDLDLFVTGTGADELYRNDGGSTPFTAVGAALGMADAANGRSAAWGDYDQDGLLDLYVANKLTANRLYHNTGSGFTNVAAALGVADTGNSEGCAFVDYDGDGDADIYVANTGGTKRLYRNDGATFTDVAAALGLADVGTARSCTWADYDGDGDQDLYLSRYGEANTLYRQIGGTFTSVGLGLDDAAHGESAAWADFDLDGDLDLFLANYTDPDRFWRHDGGAFVDISAQAGLNHDGPSLGAAWADADADGDPDLALGGYGGTSRVYVNDYATGNHWLQVQVVGTYSNASAIGARVRVVTGLVSQTRWVGGGNGYLSHNDLVLTFGLGSHTAADSVVVDWPRGGNEAWTALAADQLVLLTEATGSPTGVLAGAVPPARFGIASIFPNPSRETTTIAFDVASKGPAQLAVFDVLGRHVATVREGTLELGRHDASWDGRDGAGRMAAPGVYFVKLRAAGIEASRKVVRVR